MNLIAIRAKNAVTHPGMTRKICDRDPFQSQSPGGKQMEAAVPRKVVDPGRSFEKNNGRPGGSRRPSDHPFGDPRDLEIIKPADQAALNTLFEEFSKHEDVR